VLSKELGGGSDRSAEAVIIKRLISQGNDQLRQ
jgi:hypothetical protein